MTSVSHVKQESAPYDTSTTTATTMINAALPIISGALPVSKRRSVLCGVCLGEHGTADCPRLSASLRRRELKESNRRGQALKQTRGEQKGTSQTIKQARDTDSDSATVKKNQAGIEKNHTGIAHRKQGRGGVRVGAGRPRDSRD